MSQNFSAELDRDAVLQNLNDHRAKAYYGAITFLGVLILVGVIGNLHVLFIYRKTPSTNFRLFVCFLAVIDFVSCTICIPFNIVILRYPLMYHDNAACKIFKFLTSSVVVGSGLSLLVIAVERYRKICKPNLSQISHSLAKMLCILVPVLAGLCSIPRLHFYGVIEAPTKLPNITGYKCSVRFELRDTVFRRFYVACICVASLGICLALTVLYIFIGFQIWQHQAKMRKYKMSISSKGQKEDSIPVTNTEQSERKPIQTVTNACFSTAKQSNTHDVESDQPQLSEQATSVFSSANKSNQNHGGQRLVEREEDFDQFNQMKRTTYMFIWISLVCFLSYIPTPVVKVYRIFNKSWDKNLSYFEAVTVSVVLTSFYLNNVVNFFVYTVYDSTYRRELICCYGKMFCRK